jgi:hypothetical protein
MHILGGSDEWQHTTNISMDLIVKNALYFPVDGHFHTRRPPVNAQKLDTLRQQDPFNPKLLDIKGKEIRPNRQIGQVSTYDGTDASPKTILYDRSPATSGSSQSSPDSTITCRKRSEVNQT